jgi:hypothetical protein
VDGSGWEGVYRILKDRGFAVSIVQNSTITLSGDVATTRRTIAALDGPVILVAERFTAASESGYVWATR